METNHIHEDVPGGVPLKMWTRGVPVEDAARRQLQNAARLPIVFRHIAAMPDVHLGIGATVGSVIPTLMAIIPAALWLAQQTAASFTGQVVERADFGVTWGPGATRAV